MTVFAAVGADALDRVEDLLLDPRLQRVDSPRHAELLLVAGAVREADRPALRIVHDQLPAPRATLWWGAAPFEGAEAPHRLASADDPTAMLQQLGAQLRNGALAGESDLQPDEPPAPWRGVGPHGQGGKGMMGGKPYGRAMAMTDDDLRDGLALDAFKLSIGPYLCHWPPGLVLELVLQGDVIQHARVVREPLAAALARNLVPGIELRCAAGMLSLLQLPALAERCQRAARSLQQGEAVDTAALHAAVRRSGALLAIAPTLGECQLDGESSSVRQRLARWLQPQQAHRPQPAPQAHHRHQTLTLSTLLRGLEWMEARLVVASFTPAQLQPLARAEPSASDEAAGSMHEHSH